MRLNCPRFSYFLNPKGLALMAFTGLMLALFYFKPPKHPVLCLDKAALEGKFIRQLAESKASSEQVKAISVKFAKALDQTLGAYSQKYAVLVLDKKYCLAGCREINEEIMQGLAMAMGQS